MTTRPGFESAVVDFDDFGDSDNFVLCFGPACFECERCECPNVIILLEIVCVTAYLRPHVVITTSERVSKSGIIGLSTGAK